LRTSIPHRNFFASQKCYYPNVIALATSSQDVLETFGLCFSLLKGPIQGSSLLFSRESSSQLV